MGPYKPLRTWVDEFIPHFMEIMGADRPDRTYATDPTFYALGLPWGFLDRSKGSRDRDILAPKAARKNLFGFEFNVLLFLKK